MTAFAAPLPASDAPGASVGAAGDTAAGAGTPVADSGIVWVDAQRESAFTVWLARVAAAHRLAPQTLRPASADASFRRYFRIDVLAAVPASGDGIGDEPTAATSRIVMDAPPAHEDSEPFVRIAALLAAAGLRVPEVLDHDRTHGFLLLTDLGRRTLLQALTATHDAAVGRALFTQAIDALLLLQGASKPGLLPPCDRALLARELALFPDWYVERHRGVQLDATQRATLTHTFDTIVAHNLAAAPVFMHRDFMPRNLMLADDAAAAGAPGAALGVLDFQDAVYGPITYDIASLMRDAFISWDEDFVLDVTIRYWERARRAGLPVGADFGEFWRGVEWMGLQRHLKVAGIFARLTLRDGKPQYLADAPRFLGYIRATAGRYRELTPLLRLLDAIEGTAPAASGWAFGRV